MEITPIDLREIDKIAGNVYEGIIVSSKRARQINSENKIEFNALLSTIPEATTDVSSLSPSSNIPKQENEFVSIAQVQSIIEASQAESAGLQIGDIILEYDGVPINSAQQLVREVEKKAQVNQIEMVIVRQKIPTRLILNGGFIGIRILTKKIPRAEFNAFQ